MVKLLDVNAGSEEALGTRSSRVGSDRGVMVLSIANKIEAI